MNQYFIAILLLMVSVDNWASNIEAIRFSDSQAQTRIVFDLSSEPSFQIFKLDNPYRVVIDLDQEKAQKKIKLPPLSGSRVKAIRYASRENKRLRIVFDLMTAVDFKTYQLGSDSEHLHRLIVDLSEPNLEKPKTQEKAKDLTKRNTEQEIQLPKQSQTQQLSPKQSSKTINTQAEIETVIGGKTKPSHATITSKADPKIAPRDIIIAIDAGHGGKDSGAVGKRGTKEKDIVLIIARKLARLVEKEPGMQPYLIRDKDVFITLRERIKRARNQKADMFISIHADAFDDPRAKGASVFVLSQRGASSEAAQMLADKENAADLVGGISIDDKDDDLASVLLDLSQTASLVASTEVAETVLFGLKRVGNTHKKHVESAAFVVLKSPDIPSILVETAFISNPGEEKKLRNPKHQDKLAKAMMTGIREYFQRNPLPNTRLSQQYKIIRGDTLSTIAKRFQVSLDQLKRHNGLSNDVIRVGDVLSIP